MARGPSAERSTLAQARHAPRRASTNLPSRVQPRGERRSAAASCPPNEAASLVLSTRASCERMFACVRRTDSDFVRPMTVGVEVLPRFFLALPVVAAGDQEVDDRDAHRDAERAGD